MLSIVAAIAENNIIGKDNKLIWRLPEDLKRFKALTMGKTIIMGRKTFESLGRVLPNRKHIILTQDRNFMVENENVEIIYNIQELEPYVNASEEYFVIGGGMIYQLLLPKVTKLYITKIHQDFKGDTYFPVISLEEWIVNKREKGIQNKENPYDYEYIEYIRK